MRVLLCVGMECGWFVFRGKCRSRCCLVTSIDLQSEASFFLSDSLDFNLSWNGGYSHSLPPTNQQSVTCKVCRVAAASLSLHCSSVRLSAKHTQIYLVKGMAHSPTLSSLDSVPDLYLASQLHREQGTRHHMKGK